jgi:tetrapyrrole methylase family protein/MazG family protein
MSPIAPSDKELRTFNGLRRVVATLRAPGGCPWDRAQTHATLRPYLTEEAAEALEAIDSGDPASMCEELGDLLFQVLIHVQLAEERGDFKMADLVYGLATKLVRRHPHVFADAAAETPDAVIEQWDDLKRRERGDRSLLAGIPAGLPALARAQAMLRRATKAGFGFRWESAEQVWSNLRSELDDLERASTPEERLMEAGDALFALVNVIRYYGVDAEDALRVVNGVYARRLEAAERIAGEREIDLREADMETKVALWEQAKAAG